MRVAIISNLFPPHVIGGYELGCWSLAKAAQQAGCQVRVLTSVAVGRLRKRFEVQDLDVNAIFSPIYDYERTLSNICLPLNPAAFGGIMPENVLALQHAVEDFRPDAIWMFNPLGLGPVGILEAAVSSGVPTTLHLMDHLDPVVESHQIGFNVLPRWLRAKSKTRAIACSAKTLECNQRLGKFSDSRVIPNGVSMPQGCQEPRSNSGHAFNLIYFGQIEIHKGILHLLRAFKHVQSTVEIPVKLHFAGAGSTEAKRALDRLVDELDLVDDVVQHGFCEPTELKSLLSQMQLAVFLLGTQEPFAYVVIEAIQAGVPVVVSRSAGCAEFLPADYPFFIDHRENAPDVAAVLQSAIGSRDRLRPWCKLLQEAVQKNCDLENSCLPRCMDFLESVKDQSTESIETIPFSEARKYENSVRDALSSWYAQCHLGNLCADEQPRVEREVSIGKSIERWVRHRIPMPLRQRWRSAMRPASVPKAS